MKKMFYVLWTYVANYSRLMPTEAETADEAMKSTCGYFGRPFDEKATVFVFEHPPTILQYKGVRMTVDGYREASKEDR